MITPIIHCKYSMLCAPDELLPHPKNPNKHPDKQVEALAKSIQRFGWRHPVVVSSLTGRIVAGHCRRLAAKLLECEVPIDVQDFASEDEELAVLLADNVIPELAELDQKMLVEHREHFLELNWSLEEIGFVDDSPRSSAGTSAGADIAIKWSVLIECVTEQEQRNMIELLESSGVKCKAIMT